MDTHSTLAVAAAIAHRHQELAAVVGEVPDHELLAPSLLPGWNRLIVLCHLRYGAEANLAVTQAAIAGRPASYYPEGRTKRRPSTLEPRPGERPRDVVKSLAAASAELDALWCSLDEDQWRLIAHEPADNPDLGSVTLGFLALLRLTEVEVHGSDLDIGASPWSDVFIDAALPMRLRWLSTRRSNHAWSDDQVHGAWMLAPHDGTPFVITAAAEGVTVSEAGKGAGGDRIASDAQIAGPKRDLLSFLLGRSSLAELAVTGDLDLAAAFKRAFPSP